MDVKFAIKDIGILCGKKGKRKSTPLSFQTYVVGLSTLLYLILILSFAVGLQVQAQEVNVESKSLSTYDKKRQYAREKLSMFLDYCYVIADTKTDITAKNKYIQKALDLFLLNESYIFINMPSGNGNKNRELKISTDKFLEKLSKGFYAGNPVVSEYNYYHAHKMIPLSDEKVEVELCMHKDVLKNLYDDSECSFKDYKHCVMAKTFLKNNFGNEEIGKIIFLTMIRITFNKNK